MAVKAIQLIQIGTAMGSEEKARETIRLMKEAGYDGIELNGFMMKKMPPMCSTFLLNGCRLPSSRIFTSIPSLPA